jgi:selenoprotein W-related protein
LRQHVPSATVELIPGSGGVFEVTVDGVLVFSKKALGRHANPGEVLRLIQQKP